MRQFLFKGRKQVSISRYNNILIRLWTRLESFAHFELFKFDDGIALLGAVRGPLPEQKSAVLGDAEDAFVVLAEEGSDDLSLVP